MTIFVIILTLVLASELWEPVKLTVQEVMPHPVWYPLGQVKKAFGQSLVKKHQQLF